MRKDLRVWLRQLHGRLGLTTVFVTHDQEEALELADLVAVINAGKVEQLGTPDQLRHEPATDFVADFLGASSATMGGERRNGAKIVHLH